MNKSIKKCCICSNSETGEFIMIGDNKYHLSCIEKMQKENQQLKEQLELSEKARKEAIELIKELYDNTDDTTCYDIDKDEKEILLKILDIDKGE